jgi:8-oxo-dGTP pyrophosphatase MutT (NUDIX family)
MKWTVARSRHVLQDRWISVRADDYVTATGVAVAPYYLIEYPDWVHVVALDATGHIVLVRQFRPGLGDVALELPGGQMDHCETDPIRTGMRELSEETGYGGGDQPRLIASLSPNPASHTNRIHVVAVTNVRLLGAASPDPTEDLQVELMSIQDAIELSLRGGFVNAAHLGLLFLTLQTWGYVRFTEQGV